MDPILQALIEEMSREELGAVVGIFRSTIEAHKLVFADPEGLPGILRDRLEGEIRNFDNNVAQMATPGEDYKELTPREWNYLLRENVQVIRNAYRHWARVCLS